MTADVVPEQGLQTHFIPEQGLQTLPEYYHLYH
jgi:hypothetical protein